jgi:hypothetical protein
MSTMVTNLNILPHCLLKIVSDYCGTDSLDKVLELVKSFEINKVYEVVYYSNDNYDILNHLNMKYKTNVTSGGMTHNDSFSYNLNCVGLLNVCIEPLCKDSRYSVGYKLHIIIT